MTSRYSVRQRRAVGVFGLRFGAMLVAAVVLLPAPPAATQVVPGGGPATTDCFVTYDSHPAANNPTLRPKYVKCADQDVSCGDADGRLGYCGYDVQLTLNSTNFPSCTPQDFPVGSFLIPFSGAQNDDHPKHIPAFEPLQQFVDDQLPLDTAVGDVNLMSGFVSVVVPMSIGFSSRCPVFKTTTVSLQPTMCTLPVDAKGRCPPGGKRDSDTFKLICTPAADPVTKLKVSPCDGVTSTFQQIQDEIFDRKCSTLAGCHGSAIPPHNLCLKPSCNGDARHAYTDLVAVDPANEAALNDKLERVMPGDPGHSLLAHKINGGAQLNDQTGFVGAYGLRMPYNNPFAGRARPRLSSGEMQLITDWIVHGAPESGLVSTYTSACK